MRATILTLLILSALGSNGTAAAFPQEPERQSPSTPAAPPDILSEVRVHGNHSTPDADVLKIAGLTLGQALSVADLAAVEKRLRASGRFEDVEVRRRSRSLSGGGEVALILIVREHPLPAEALEGTPAPLRPFHRLFASGMFLPVLRYNDGYGFTYGARVTFVDTLGRGSRVSVPLTWGGTRSATVEMERPVSRGPVDRLTASASLWSRTNPFFERDEDRREVRLGASRTIAGALRVGVQAGYGNVSFGNLDERFGVYGAHVAVDTRHDPVFPRDAVYAEAGWTALRPSVSAPVNRYRAEVRAYKGVIRQAVLSVRWQYAGADGSLPAYERSLLGGATSLRGYRTGKYSGDNLMAGSLELRVPLSSPLGISRAGFTVFTDIGTVWDHGTRLDDARVRRGVGGGLFLLASVFQLNLDVAVSQGSGARVHLSTGLQF